VGTTVNYYLDPLHRAAWLEQGRTLIRLHTREEHARRHSAADVAATLDGAARRASDEAAARRAERLDRDCGPGTAAAGAEAYAAALAAPPEPDEPTVTREGGVRTAPVEVKPATPAVAPNTPDVVQDAAITDLLSEAVFGLGYDPESLILPPPEMPDLTNLLDSTEPPPEARP
jgi:hypothetical protein